jgi:ABC-2 type transport system ATP-binding protein
MLIIKDLVKTYEGGVQALRGIDLEVKRGDFFALLGANGAGKSTTIGIISSLVIKDSGTVKIAGIDIDEDFNEARSHLGITPQEFNFSNFDRIDHIVTTNAGYYGVPLRLAKERARKYLKLLGLWEIRETRAIELSGGMKRRLMMARALTHEPELLVLDEPTAGVDVELRRTMWDFLEELNRHGTTIILTTHYLEEAEQLCRNVAVIDEGKIVYDGAMRQVVNMLSQQTFVLDLAKSSQSLPKMEGIRYRELSQNSIEINLPTKRPLNEVFTLLSKHGLEVMSMRPKTNRLEQMFLTLTSGNHDST